MPVITDEEERAALHRQQAANRAAFQKALFASLAGDPEAAARVKEGWQPIIDARAEARDGARA